MIRLNAKSVLLAAEFMATCDVRYYLNGVYVEKHPNGGAVLVGTDGHRMMIVRDEMCEFASEPVIINLPKATLQALRKNIGRANLVIDEQLRVEVDGMPVFIQIEKPFIDGKFPDWRAIMPEPAKLEEGLIGSFNAKYVAHAYAAAAKYGNSKYGALVKWYGQRSDDEHHNHAALFRIGRTAEFDAFGLIMPMRDDITSPMPDWYGAISKKPETQAAA